MGYRLFKPLEGHKDKKPNEVPGQEENRFDRNKRGQNKSKQISSLKTVTN